MKRSEASLCSSGRVMKCFISSLLADHRVFPRFGLHSLLLRTALLLPGSSSHPTNSLPGPSISSRSWRPILRFSGRKKGRTKEWAGSPAQKRGPQNREFQVWKCRQNSALQWTFKLSPSLFYASCIIHRNLNHRATFFVSAK